MNILYCHNVYQQAGGEDNCADDEIRLLQSHGHHVIEYKRHNDDIDGMSKFAVAAKTFWNRRSYRDVSQLIREHQIELLHAMNTFPLISPAVYYAAKKHSVAVVQSVQNFRLFCPGVYLMRDNKVCLDCVGKLPIPALRHRCYRGSLSGTAVLSGMLVAHRMMGTWKNMVDKYCACTEFGKEIYVRGGLPAEKVFVKPNFIDPVPEPGTGGGGYVLFVGRISEEKGIRSMLQAWREMKNPPPLKILGDGPLVEEVAQAARQVASIETLGWQSQDAVRNYMRDASCLIVPSLWFEGFPKTIVESIAVGTPVLASNLGAMSEVIIPGKNGLHFDAGSVAQIKQAVVQHFDRSDQWPELRRLTREDFLTKYTAQQNYELMLEMYEGALRSSKRKQIETSAE